MLFLCVLKLHQKNSKIAILYIFDGVKSRKSKQEHDSILRIKHKYTICINLNFTFTVADTFANVRYKKKKKYFSY